MTSAPDEPRPPRLAQATVYAELRRMAEGQLRQERSGHTLQATALVHEAYLRLHGPASGQPAERRAFFASAAQAMRRILIEHARARGRAKRGGGWRRLGLDAALEVPPENFDGIVAVDEALRRLEEVDPRAAEVVQLRFFAGLGFEEIAMTLETSERTVMREWAFARTWLFRALADGEDA